MAIANQTDSLVLPPFYSQNLNSNFSSRSYIRIKIKLLHTWTNKDSNMAGSYIFIKGDNHSHHIYHAVSFPCRPWSPRISISKASYQL